MNPYRIAVPIIGPSMCDALLDIDEAAKLAVDIIELRIDCITHPDLEILLRHSNIPKIVTNRIKAEGGKFEGSETKRIGILQDAIYLCAEYVDIELNHFSKKLYFSSDNKTKLIVSNHNFERTPDNLEEIYEKIAGVGADIVKIATMARTYDDTLRMLEFVKKVSKNDQGIIGICMGQEGVKTRIYGPVYGSYLTFASLPGKPSAPGQLTVEELRDCWKKI